MSERPEWMPSYAETVSAINSDSYISGLSFPSTDRLILRTGLRAQIAVLEEMQTEMFNEFGDGYEMGTEGKWMGRKLDALRKELGV